MKIRHLLNMIGSIVVLVLLMTSCSTAAFTTAAVDMTPTAVPTIAVVAMPQGELISSFTTFGNENFLPWIADNGASQLNVIVYDVLVYFDEINKTFIPGLAESWEISPDAMILTYHLRHGVQFQDDWGEFTSADVKYNFERLAGKDSRGHTAATRNIKDMETPDPYTLVVNFKTPAPTFLGLLSFGNGGSCQGMVSKKYLDSVGDSLASQKPIGTGPYKLLESKSASYYKFEAQSSHWRVVPEFKTLTVRMIPEVSSVVAALKNREIDLASVTPEQLADLKSSGLGTEVYGGGTNLVIQWGGLFIPEDSRFNPEVHNKDPWTDVRVRKALTISIDRQAICDAIYVGAALPIGVPLFAAGTDQYQYPFDPVAARLLLKEANAEGMSFKVISSVNPGMPEAPRIMEALAGYWQQIGLEPRITAMDYNAYGNLRTQAKTSGDLALFKFTSAADMLTKATMMMTPDCAVPLFQDIESYAIWSEGSAKVNPDERAQYVDKLNQYFYENYGPIPIVNIGSSWAWNSSKVSVFAHSTAILPQYLEYVRHPQPLNTFRLFTPFPGR